MLSLLLFANFGKWWDDIYKQNTPLLKFFQANKIATVRSTLLVAAQGQWRIQAEESGAMSSQRIDYFFLLITFCFIYKSHLVGPWGENIWPKFEMNFRIFLNVAKIYAQKQKGPSGLFWNIDQKWYTRIDTKKITIYLAAPVPPPIHSNSLIGSATDQGLI